MAECPDCAAYLRNYAETIRLARGAYADDPLPAGVRETLVRAVQVICKAQNNEGGWRYQPIPQQADISVTISQIMALRSARNAGLEVPKSVVEKCIEYIKACQSSTDGSGSNSRSQ